MTDELEQFNEQLQQEVVLFASEEGQEESLHSRFTRYMLDILAEAGEVDDAAVAMYEARGARASAFEVSEDEGTLHVFLSDYRSTAGAQPIGKTEIDAHVRRLGGFVSKAADGLWKSLEETSSGWDMAQRIDEVWQRVAEVRMTVLTNAELKTSVPQQFELDGRPVHVGVWDLDRLYKLASSSRAQEPIHIDLTDLWEAPLPCLGPHGDPGYYDAYLLTIPGELLARIYEIHGPRLLELNVRSFLQSRGKVNRGIQETIRDEPARFLAYNNGVSMTASRVEVIDHAMTGRAITHIHDLQIVNGGQTTASLHYAKVKNKADLSNLHVQAKLSVVEPAQLDELVPRISQYANSQNRVNMADFSANDPFHVELEKLSRTVWAPAPSGGTQMTRWFYERARGQYADAHASERTPARQRDFKKVHPLNQKFTKTDVAKFENTWDQLPATVSMGAEKNFREFMLRLAKRGAFTPDVPYFENLIAKAILFRSAEKLVGGLQLGGYRAQTVTYTLAKLLHTTGQRIDLGAIYRAQGLSESLQSAVMDLAPVIHAALVRTAGVRNVSEWAKKQDCWTAIQAIDWRPGDGLADDLIKGGQRTKTTTSSSVGEVLSKEEEAAMEAVKQVPADTWFQISQWAKETGNMQAWQRGLAFSLGRIASSDKEPSRKQANQGQKIFEEATRLGFAASNGS
ncbi:AIPR family protein [Nocardioides sp. Root151]|uniref:AIPR family protein n=1 Tax=Nocardioides sp. Root151 TaxID=1736475 RepID=UPI000702C95E|nr:AIPR family protein [Nocardioides sp. Root151]KQZ67105.1 hypothetical protein ASD66_19125 [Nocardioides sp. Root151]